MQYLYRHYNSENTLLYVGISINPCGRLKQHRNLSSWFDEIVSINLERFDTREDVLEAEKNAIITEKPIYNIKHANNEIVDEAKEESNEFVESKNIIASRIITTKPCYSPDEVCEMLTFPLKNKSAEKFIKNEGIGFILIKNPRSRLGRKRMVITGWQLISYLEGKQSLEEKEMVLF